MKENYTVYMFIFPNGKRYIGITSRDPHIRWKNGLGYGDTLVGRAISKYSWENVKKVKLKRKFTAPNAKEKERQLIKAYKTLDRDFGYNMTEGGDGSYGYKHTKESKAKMSRNHYDVTGENNPFYHRHHSEETKQKLRELNVGKVIPEEVRKKMGMKGKDHPLYGKHHSEESRKKMSEAQKGPKSHNWGKKFSEETCKKMSESVKKSWEKRDRTVSQEARKKMSDAHKRYYAMKRGELNALNSESCESKV